MGFALVLTDLMNKYKVTKYRLATDLGVSKGTIANYLNENTEPQASIRSKILDYFETLEKGTTPIKEGKFDTDNKKSIRRQLNEMYEEEKQDEIISSKHENDLEQNIYAVPLLPIAAQAGSLNDFITNVKESECERIVSPIRGADFAMSVAGDSMSPEYPSGSQILIKKINERLFIEWGKVYVLDTTNGTVIKIVNESEKEGHIKCTSIHADQKRYAPFDIPLSGVIGMYRVMMCMAIK